MVSVFSWDNLDTVDTVTPRYKFNIVGLNIIYIYALTLTDIFVISGYEEHFL